MTHFKGFKRPFFLSQKLILKPIFDKNHLSAMPPLLHHQKRKLNPAQPFPGPPTGLTHKPPPRGAVFLHVISTFQCATYKIFLVFHCPPEMAYCISLISAKRAWFKECDYSQHGLHHFQRFLYQQNCVNFDVLIKFKNRPRSTYFTYLITPIKEYKAPPLRSLIGWWLPSVLGYLLFP